MKARTAIATLCSLLVACTSQPVQKKVDGWIERPLVAEKKFDVAWFNGDWRLCEVGSNCQKPTHKTAILSVPLAAIRPSLKEQEVNHSEQVVVHFDFDSANPKDLDALNLFLAALPEHQTLLVTGYTDSLGDDEYNQLLAQKRANKVSAWIRKRGIRNPIEVAARGACCYLAANDAERGRAMNRRVIVEIIHEEK